MAEIIRLRPVVEEPHAPSAQVVTLAARINWRSLQMGMNPARAASRCYALLREGKQKAAAEWWTEHIAAARRAGDGPFRRSDLDRLVAAYTQAVRAEIDRLRAEAADKGAR